MGDKKKDCTLQMFKLCSNITGTSEVKSAFHLNVQVALFTLLVKCADVDSANRGQETYGRGAASDPTYCVSSTIVIG